MRFTATVQNATTQAAKLVTVKDWNNPNAPPTLQGGAILLTLSIPRPAIPAPPVIPNALRYDKRQKPGRAPAAFVEPAAKKDEDAAAHKKRISEERKAYNQRVKSHEAASKQYDASTAARAAAQETYDAQLAAHARRAAVIGQHFNAYAQLAGAGSLLTGLPVSVSLTPDARAIGRYLPGFVPAALLDIEAVAAPLMLDGPQPPESDDTDIGDAYEDDEI